MTIDAEAASRGLPDQTAGALRSALAELGSATQVFEVTDLVIPAGTDWSTTGHVLGTLEYDRAKSLLDVLYVEFSAPTAVGQPTVTLDVGDDPDYSLARTYDELDLPAGYQWTRRTNPDAEFSNGFPSQGPPPPVTTLTVAIHTLGPTIAPITVVRARAAFLVI